MPINHAYYCENVYANDCQIKKCWTTKATRQRGFCTSVCSLFRCSWGARDLYIYYGSKMDAKFDRLTCRLRNQAYCLRRALNTRVQWEGNTFKSRALNGKNKYTACRLGERKRESRKERRALRLKPHPNIPVVAQSKQAVNSNFRADICVYWLNSDAWNWVCKA